MTAAIAEAAGFEPAGCTDEQLRAVLLSTSPLGRLASILEPTISEFARRGLSLDLWCDDCEELWETPVYGIPDLCACPHCRGGNVSAGPVE